MDVNEKASCLQLIKYTYAFRGLIKNSAIDTERMQQLTDLFIQRDFQRIISKLMGYIHLDTKVGLKFYPDSLMLSSMQQHKSSEEILNACMLSGAALDRYREPAYVEIEKRAPLFHHKAFKHWRTSMRIGESMQYESPACFTTCVTHELMHILLWSLRHLLCRSEIATDVATAIFLGDVMREGRFLRNKGRLGYLTDDQFWIISNFLKIMRFLGK